jgi:TolB-like protein
MKNLLFACLALLFPLSLQGMENIAVLEFEANGVSVGEAQTVANKFQNELIKLAVFTVIERTQMAEILKEQGFQQTGCTSTACAVQIGMLLGARFMIGGNLGKVGNLYSLSTRIIDVQTGRILAYSETDVQETVEYLYMIGVEENLRKLIADSKLKVTLPPPSKERMAILNGEYLPASGRIVVPHGGIRLLESPNAPENSGKEIKRGARFQVVGETERFWVVLDGGRKFYVTKTWTKRLRK